MHSSLRAKRHIVCAVSLARSIRNKYLPRRAQLGAVFAQSFLSQRPEFVVVGMLEEEMQEPRYRPIEHGGRTPDTASSSALILHRPPRKASHSISTARGLCNEL